MTTTENTPATEAEITEQAAAVLGGVDLTAALSTAVRKAVNAQVTAAAKTIAEGAITEFLTPAVVATMRETAILEAEAAVNPDAAAAVGASAEPEPAPEPESEMEKEEEEKQRKLHFTRLDLFVEKYIAQTYRRQVTARGHEGKVRWCPQWWDHAEAVGRLEALWLAWEESRLGEGAELATWWVSLADPMMAALFDPEGVFKYCSVSDGHRTTMTKLPTVAAPSTWFADGHAHDDPEPGAVSGIVLPRPATGRSKVVLQIEDFGE